MTRRNFAPTVGFVVLVFAGVPSHVMAQPSSAATEQNDQAADKLFAQAAARAKQKDWPAAYDLFKKSFELVPSGKTAANLGKSAERLGKSGEAARYLAFALRVLPPTVAPATKKAMADLLGKIERDVTRVALSVDPAQAEVFVNGESRGRASELLDPVFLDPGTHTIEARAEGFVARTETVHAKKSVQKALAIQLSPLPDAGLGPGDPGGPVVAPQPGAGGNGSSTGHAGDSGARPETSDPRWTVGIVGGGLTVVALTAGIVFKLKGTSAADDEQQLSRRLDAIGPSACANGSSTAAKDCAAYADKLDERQSANRWSNISFVAATGLAVGTVAAVLLWPRRDEAVTVGGSASPNHAVIQIRGAF